MEPRPLSRRRLLAATASATAATGAVLAGCLGGGDDGDAGNDENDADENADDVLEIETREGDEDEPEFVFDPAVAEVEPGTTVRWTNTDGVFHTVTATESLEDRTPSEAFDEEVPSEGDTFEWTPEADGVQHYYCEPHAGFMIGSLVVGDVDDEERDEIDEFHEDDDSENDDADDETEAEFVDATGEDTVEIVTREGDEDGEPGFVFDPAFVTVDEGTTIEWTNTDGVFHTVTSTDAIDRRSGGGDVFDATLVSEGETFEWTADEAGTQPYYCSPHAGFMYGAIEIV